MKVLLKLIDLVLLRENQVPNKTRIIYYNSIFCRIITFEHRQQIVGKDSMNARKQKKTYVF